MVTPRGWWDLADSDLFYPCDLPEDWRLSYFANCFRATLLPAAIWTTTDELTVKQWHDDVPAGFRFAAERTSTQPQEDGAQQRAPAALMQRLELKLDGWLDPLDGSASRTTAGSDTNRYLRYERPRSELQVTTDQHRYGLVAPAELHGDLRRAKDWLNRTSELQARAPTLVILERPTSNALTAWQELLELLGLG